MKEKFYKEKIDFEKEGNRNLENENLKPNKNLVECLTNRLDQVEEIKSGLEVKVEELEHSDKNKEKNE
jgi:hypothetical protein